MPTKVQIKKGASQKIRESNLSPSQARRIKKAIAELDSVELEKLQKNWRVRKLKIPNLQNVYSFRAGISARILFTPIDDHILIHDIVTVGKKQKIKSIMSKTSDVNPSPSKKTL